MSGAEGSFSAGLPAKLIVTIPAYNEEATVGQAIREIPRSVPGVARVAVLVCDDGSTDGTVQAAREAGADYIVSLRRNFGLTVAFGTALQAAVEQGADVIVNIDADCQYLASEIPMLIAPILRGEADMVSGNRQVASLEHMPASKKYGNRMGSFMLRTVAGSGVVDASSGFRAFSRECALRLNPYIGHTYTHQTLIQATHTGMVVKEVPVTFRPSARDNGESRLIGGVFGHIVRSMGTILRTMTAYRPLAVLGGLGLLFLILGALVGLIPILAWIQQGNTEGHIQSLIASFVLILMGIQFVVFGLLADAVAANRRTSDEILYRFRAGRSADGVIVSLLDEQDRAVPVSTAGAAPVEGNWPSEERSAELSRR
jgi:hypothetical protein